MKQLCFSCLLLLLLPIAGRCQLWLHPGDSYTYEFTNFTAAGSTTAGPGTTLGIGMAGVDGNEGFLLEIFENSTSETPLLRFTDIRFIPNPIELGNAWQDRQGVVRFAVTSGSVSVDILFGSIVYLNGDIYVEIFDILDSDNDGVMDHEDRCPTTAPGVMVDEHGCNVAPPEIPIVAEIGTAADGWAALTDQFTIVSWTQTNRYEDVTISARLYSGGLEETGTVYLTTRVGPGTTLAHEVAAASFTFPGISLPWPVQLFSGLTLGPGTYYLIVSGATNVASAWYGSRYPHVIADLGVTHHGNGFVFQPAAYPPASVSRPYPGIFQIFAVSGTRVPANRPPVASAGTDQQVECSGTATGVTLDGRQSSDPDRDLLTYTWWEGATRLGLGPTLNIDLPSGSHNIRLVVSDPSGASSEDTLLVHIQDTTAPLIEVLASPAVLWPPNGKMVPVTIGATVLDACDAMAAAHIVAVQSDEPSTTIDWEITSGLTLNLRARRLGTATGRTYRITMRHRTSPATPPQPQCPYSCPGKGCSQCPP